MFYIHYIPNSTIALMIVSLSYFIQKFVIAVIMIIFLKKKRIGLESLQKSIGDSFKTVNELLRENVDLSWHLNGVHFDETSSLIEIGRASVGKECRSRWSPYH